MIQDIFPDKLNNTYAPEAVPAENDTAVVSTPSGMLIRTGEGELFPTMGELGIKSGIYLFSVNEKRYFLCAAPDKISDDFGFAEIRAIRDRKDIGTTDIYAAFTAKHLADWYRDVTFCGRCGKRMTHSEKERAMTCSCGYTAYPRIMPAVIVGVINGDRILITRYRTGYRHNALIAGFTEIGETMEETVAREVMEEAGIKVKNIRYYRSQPWGMAGDILLGYYCDVDGDDDIHMDEGELRYAEWVKREDIELQPNELSLTNEMMKMFKEGVIT